MELNPWELGHGLEMEEVQLREHHTTEASSCRRAPTRPHSPPSTSTASWSGSTSKSRIDAHVDIVACTVHTTKHRAWVGLFADLDMLGFKSSTNKGMAWRRGTHEPRQHGQDQETGQDFLQRGLEWYF